MYLELPMPGTAVAQWEQNEQGKSLFWKENSRGSVYTNNYDTSYKGLGSLEEGQLNSSWLDQRKFMRNGALKIEWLVLDM